MLGTCGSPTIIRNWIMYFHDWPCAWWSQWSPPDGAGRSLKSADAAPGPDWCMFRLDPWDEFDCRAVCVIKFCFHKWKRGRPKTHRSQVLVILVQLLVLFTFMYALRLGDRSADAENPTCFTSPCDSRWNINPARGGSWRSDLTVGVPKTKGHGCLNVVLSSNKEIFHGIPYIR